MSLRSFRRASERHPLSRKSPIAVTVAGTSCMAKWPASGTMRTFAFGIRPAQIFA